MSENWRARNSDKKEGGQLRRRRSEIWGGQERKARRKNHGKSAGERAQTPEEWRLDRTRKRKESGPPGREVHGLPGETCKDKIPLV